MYLDVKKLELTRFIWGFLVNKWKFICVPEHVWLPLCKCDL